MEIVDAYPIYKAFCKDMYIFDEDLLSPMWRNTTHAHPMWRNAVSHPIQYTK